MLNKIAVVDEALCAVMNRAVDLLDRIDHTLSSVSEINELTKGFVNVAVLVPSHLPELVTP